MLAEQETTEILRLLRLLCERSGVEADKGDDRRAFEEETQHAEILRQIEGEIENRVEEITDIMQHGGRNGSEA
jgi:hypothetical protein